MGIGPFMKMDARVKPHGHQLTPGVSRASEASALARAERDTDLGFTRDRRLRARKSGKPDLRGPSARLAKRDIGGARCVAPVPARARKSALGRDTHVTGSTTAIRVDTV